MMVTVVGQVWVVDILVVAAVGTIGIAMVLVAEVGLVAAGLMPRLVGMAVVAWAAVARRRAGVGSVGIAVGSAVVPFPLMEAVVVPQQRRKADMATVPDTAAAAVGLRL